MKGKVMKGKKCLILSDGMLGHQNQSVRVVEKLGFDKYDILKLKRRRFIGKVLSYINPIAITTEADILDAAIKKERYDVVLGGGSVPQAVMLWVKKKYPHIKIVCLMDPKKGYKSYDVIAAPTHDTFKYAGKNVIRHTGALSGFSKEDLSQAKKNFKKEFSKFKKPLIGVLIGGNSKGYDFTQEKSKQLVSDIITLNSKINGSVYATTSGRTGEVQTDYIYNSLTEKGFSVYKVGQGENPYRGIMAYSDIIIVTPETISMLTEACSTKAKILIFDKDSVKSSRIRSFTNELIEKGLVCEIDEFLQDSSLKRDAKNENFIENEINRVVDFIREAL
ncbi:MAG: hypothetical protein GY793_00550 [Proteobacteria bacterium]|nr:hypothetical protein [Pseudomonadota bacterium]